VIPAIRRAIRIVREFFSNPLRIEQAMTVLKASAVIGSFAYSVYLLDFYVYSRHIEAPPLSLAAAFLTMQAIAISAQLAASCFMKKVAETNRQRAAERAPGIRAKLAAHSLGDNCLSALTTQWRRSPSTFEHCLRNSLATVSGECKTRLSRLAVSLGIVEQWSVRASSRDAERRAVAAECFGLLDPEVGAVQLRMMLDDSSPHVRGVALRSVLRSASELEATLLLDRVAELPNLVRVFVAGELRDRMLSLDVQMLCGKIFSDDSSGLVALLNIMQAWRRPLPPEILPSLLEHPHPQARSAAVRLAPVSLPHGLAEKWALEALESEDDVVRQAGLAAAAQLRLAEAVPLMERCAESSNGDLAALACMAMAQAGPEGRGRLESMIVAGDERRAGWAAQALSSAALDNPYLQIQ
jgi:hypothetical protein